MSGDIVGIALVDDEPAPVSAPTDGAALLDEVANTITRFVVLPSKEAETAITLWIAATHAVSVMEHATRLVIHSPVKRCGKSRALELIAALVHEPLQTTNISVPALFRVIEAAGDEPPVLLLDEADRLLGSARKDEDNADLIACLNNGFRRGSPTWRCVGPRQEPTAFANFAFAALAAIGDRLPDTIQDRAVVIQMRRRLAGEPVAKFRLRVDLPQLDERRAQIAAWASANIAAIEAAARDDAVLVMDELEDRAQDAWEPLLAIAAVAGKDWPAKAREAALSLTRQAQEADSETPDVRLLMDVKAAFDVAGNDFIATADLLRELARHEDQPWSESDFTARRLALRLRKFGVKPGRNTSNTERGYRRGDFRDAFSRYLPSELSEVSDTGSEQGDRLDASESTDGLKRPSEMTRPAETPGQDMNRTERTLWTDTAPAEGEDEGTIIDMGDEEATP